MILVRRGLYYTLAAILCLGILGAGVLGYFSVNTAAADTAEHARFAAERYLFVSIVLALFFLALFLFIHARSLRLDRELDKVIELNRFQDFSPDMSMRKLGIMGKKITALYDQLNTLNEKKSLKISAQAELSAFLVGNIDLPLAVCDVSGTIVRATPSFGEKTGRNRTEIIGSKIDAVLPDISIQSIAFELGRLHASLEKKAGKSVVTCYPVHNRMNELSYIAFVLEKKAVYIERETRPEDQSPGAGPAGLRRVFGKILSRKEPRN